MTHGIRYVDVRGTRFGGALTLIFASLAIAFQSWLLAAATTAVLFSAAWGGARWNLWGLLYRLMLSRRLAAPTVEEREPDRPPRFANLLGGLFLMAAGALWLLQQPGAAVAASILASIVAILAFLNAAFGFCVGCRLYGVLVRDNRVATYLGLR